MALPAYVGYTIMLVFLFAPAHECVHRTAFATRGLNDATAALCGLVLLLPPRWFRVFHLAHHRHTQDAVRDPELAAPRPRTVAEYLLYLSGLPYWWAAVRTLLANALGLTPLPAFVPTSMRAEVRREARIFLAIYAVVAVAGTVWPAFGIAVLVWWVFPALLGQPALRAFLLAEHHGCAADGSQLERTRTTVSNPLMRWLCWNMSWHGEHHLVPAVPFHRLPVLARRLAKVRPRVVASGYCAVHLETLRRLGSS